MWATTGGATGSFVRLGRSPAPDAQKSERLERHHPACVALVHAPATPVRRLLEAAQLPLLPRCRGKRPVRSLRDQRKGECDASRGAARG